VKFSGEIIAQFKRNGDVGLKRGSSQCVRSEDYSASRRAGPPPLQPSRLPLLLPQERVIVAVLNLSPVPNSGAKQSNPAFAHQT
jgi:hypothetical protein